MDTAPAPPARSRTTLYAIKPAFVRRLRGMEQALGERGVTADQVTLAAVGIGAATAAALVAGTQVPLLWLLVAPLSLLRMACNALDGAMARHSGSATHRGAVLNELGDRAADTLTFAALGPVIGWSTALAAVATALAVSLVAVTAQAVTGRRLAPGPMGKPDRVAVLSLGATAAAVTGPEALRLAAWLLVAGGVATVIRRTAALWRAASGPPAPRVSGTSGAGR